MFGKRLINTGGGGVEVPTSFNTVIYTGNGSTQSITGVGFQPDFVWIKNRNTTDWHFLVDVVRGANKSLFSNSTAAETTNQNGGYVDSLNSDGFTVIGSGGNNTNGSGNDFVAWCWKAGGAAVTNTDGSISSEVSANVDAGFSVVTFSGGNSSGTTVGHGLGSPLDLLIVKNRNNSTNNWITWHKSVEQNSTSNDTFTLKGGQILILNTTLAALGYNFDGQMGSMGGENLVAYCFAEKAGFSKIGSYPGTGGTNTITIGFEPAFIMFKKTSGDNWMIIDNKRDTKTVKNLGLFPNSSNAEENPNFGVNGVEFLGNGFTITTGDGTLNASGGTYIYMAFANQF